MNRLYFVLIALFLSFPSFAVIGPILGSSTICTGTGVYLSDTSTGGLWTSSNTAVAAVGSSSGIFWGAGAGTATITYTTGSGYVTTNVTVNPSPASITGYTSVCAGYTSTLSDATPGGTWSSSATSVATVNPATGVVTGITAGYITITYTAAGCYTTTPFSVSGGSIGSLGVLGCNTVGVGDTIPFYLPSYGYGPGYGYLSSDYSIVKYATYPHAGIVGVSSGTASITIFSGATGCVVGTVTVTVTPTQLVYPPTGRSQVCVDDTAQMHDIVPGGAWSCTPSSAATISSSGLLHAISSYYEWVTYTVAGGLHCTSEIDLISLPAPISGPSAICVGDSAILSSEVTYFWSDVMFEGQFASKDTSIAKFAGGWLKGISPGIDTVTYTDPLGPRCFVTKVITVSATPTVGPISGASTVCIGTPVSLTDTTLSGTWSSSNTAVATIGSSGLLSGSGSGTANITYSVAYSCGTATATKTVTVNALPVVGGIAGASEVCALVSITLSDATAGGIWISSNLSVATIDGAGVVTALSAGIDTVKYSVSNSCGATIASVVVTVNPLPNAGTITGAGEVCVSSTTILSDLSPGGAWMVSTGGIATIGTAGDVTGIADGTATVSYTVTNSCGTAVATTIVTVNPLPAAGSITGSATLCVLASSALTDMTSGGTWSSSNISVATVDAAGMMTGVSAGIDTVKYSVANSCGIAVASLVVTINPLPDAGAIYGTTVVCALSTTVLSDAAGGGLWALDAAGVASISAVGEVTGIAAGTTMVSYSVTSTCGTAIATKILTVNPLPVAGIITGPGIICELSAVAYSDTVNDGAWSSSDATIGMVNDTGIVTGVSAGIDTIKYTVTNGCGSAIAALVVSINALPDAGVIMGTGEVCELSTALLSDISPGGAWTSGATGVATVGSLGNITGISAGTAEISYSVSNFCGTMVATAVMTVNPLPVAGPISGASNVCVASGITLSDVAAGGVWSSSDMSIATAGTDGVVTGIMPGTDTVSYTVTNVCGTASAIHLLTVNPLPDAGAISGTSELCAASVISLSDPVAGGEWLSSATGVATVGTTGEVTGVASGTTVVSYSVTNICGTAVATTTITINPLPDAGAITGTTELCATAVVTLSDLSGGGTWVSSAPGIAGVGTSGDVTGISAGVADISYQVTNVCGTAVSTVTVTVDPLPDAGIITTPDTLCILDTISLTSSVSGGTWSASNFNALVFGGIALGITPGIDTIIYTVVNSCSTATAQKLIYVVNCMTTDAGLMTEQGNEIKIYPNPAGNSITITSSEIIGSITINNAVGQTVYRAACSGRSLQVDVSSYPSGLYFVRSGNLVTKKLIKQ